MTKMIFQKGKICIIEVYLLKFYFRSYTSYINGAIINKKYLQSIKYFSTLHRCHVRWHKFHFKRMLITGLGQWTLRKAKKLCDFSAFMIKITFLENHATT